MNKVCAHSFAINKLRLFSPLPVLQHMFLQSPAPSPTICTHQWCLLQAGSPGTVLPLKTWSHTTATVHQDRIPGADKCSKPWRNTSVQSSVQDPNSPVGQ